MVRTDSPPAATSATKAAMLLATSLVAVIALGCAEAPPPDPVVVRIGVLPDESVEALRRRYAPLERHLAEALDARIELVIPTDYNDLLEAFRDGDMHLAYFGGVTFVRAHREHGAVPLVMRDIDLRFKSVFLVNQSAPGESLEDFRGRRFAFGSELSTSGHLMPRRFLAERGVSPDQFFARVVYTGSHERTVGAVSSGAVDLGVANAEIVDQMRRDGRLDGTRVRVLHTTPPYADYVWAASPRLGEGFRRRLRDAFLALDPGKEDDARVLATLGAGGFLPAGPEDFADLEKTMVELGVQPPDPTTGAH